MKPIIIDWQYVTDVPNGSSIDVEPGCEHSDYNLQQPNGIAVNSIALINHIRHFSIDVYTNQAVEIEFHIGQDNSTLTKWLGLVCLPVLHHNTIYDLPAPYDKAGFLTLSANFMKLKIVNNTGNLASPFILQARAW